MGKGRMAMSNSGAVTLGDYRRPAADALLACSKLRRGRPLEQLRTEASRFRAAYEALAEALANATIKVADAEAHQQSLRVEIESLDARIATLQTQVAELKTQVAALQADLAAKGVECAELAEELQAVYQSRSWRVTEPLRRAIAAIRRLRP
jgi:chromosome segregation ATPase